MKSVVMVVIVSGLLAAPVQAADWNDVRPGAFVGARLTIGGNSGRKASAALTFAPTQNRIYNGGMTSMRIGEGLALNLSRGTRPTLTLAGVRADTLLGLQRGRDFDFDEKLGLSDGAKVALGVGAAVLIGGGVAYAVLANRCTECDQ